MSYPGEEEGDLSIDSILVRASTSLSKTDHADQRISRVHSCGLGHKRTSTVSLTGVNTSCTETGTDHVRFDLAVEGGRLVARVV